MYILANKKNGTLYVGSTNDLLRRVWEHKNKVLPGFASKYNLDKLVYYEDCGSLSEAILREKRVKKWRRKWKLRLIEKENYNWEDLYDAL